MFPLCLFFLADFFFIPLTHKLRGLCCLQTYRVHGDDAENETREEKNKTKKTGLAKQCFQKHLQQN